MKTTFCYDEFCGIDGKIHLLNWILVVMVSAAIIATIIAITYLFVETSFFSMPLFPVDF